MARIAWSGRTPLPRALFIWFEVRPCVGFVTQPGSSPISHSMNAGAGRGPVSSFRRAGEGASRPVMCSHRAMAWAYRPPPSVEDVLDLDEQGLRLVPLVR